MENLLKGRTLHTRIDEQIIFNQLDHNEYAIWSLLLEGDTEAINYNMNKVAFTTFSAFDVGNKPSERTEPEPFYHGCFAKFFIWHCLRLSFHILTNFMRRSILFSV